MAFLSTFILQFVYVSKEREIAVHQWSDAERLEYVGGLFGARVFLSISQTLFFQELLKCACITLVSPQMMPDATVLRKTSGREVARMVVRGILGCIYGSLVLLS